MSGRETDLVSVVAPLYNERDVIREFYERVESALSGVAFELVLVDDGSTDGTTAALAELAAGDERVRVIALSRNFGHQAALTAGLDHARGNPVVMLDADLQDPPELIPEMLEKWRAGAEVVFAVRDTRAGETRFRLAMIRWFYKLFSRLSEVDLPNSGDFRLVDRAALNALLAMRERNRFLRAMTVWVGFKRASITYQRDPRFAGESKYTYRRLLRFSVDAITSFSHLPLQAATLLGLIFSVIAFLGIPVAIGFRVAGEFVPGITTVLLAVLLLGGVQLITVGIIGEYLGRVYEEVKGRPLYLVRERYNFESGPPIAATLSPIEVEAGGADLVDPVPGSRTQGRTNA